MNKKKKPKHRRSYELLEQQVIHFLKEINILENQARHEAVKICIYLQVDNEEERNKGRIEERMKKGNKGKLRITRRNQ
jgi:polyphosphate kinase 2 (PPK2 family)